MGKAILATCSTTTSKNELTVRYYNYKKPEDDLRFEYMHKPTEDSLSKLVKQHYFKLLVVLGIIVAYDFYWYMKR